MMLVIIKRRIVLARVFATLLILSVGVSLAYHLSKQPHAMQERSPQDKQIRLSDGRFVLISTDMSGSGKGSWEFRRIYRAQPGRRGALGHGWQMNNLRTLKTQRDGNIEIQDGLSEPLKAVKESVTSFRIEGKGGRLTRRPNGTITENTGPEVIEYSAPDKSGVSRMMSLSNPRVKHLSFEYTPQGQLRAITDSANHTLHYDYNRRGLLQQLKDSRNRSVLFEYDDESRLVAVTKPTGERVRYAYRNNSPSDPAANFLVSMISPWRTHSGRQIQASFDYTLERSQPSRPRVSANLILDSCGLWEDFDASGGGGVLGGDCAGGDCVGLLAGMLHPDTLIWGYKGGGAPSEGCFIIDPPDPGDDPSPHPPDTPTPPPSPPQPPPPSLPECSSAVSKDCAGQGESEVWRSVARKGYMGDCFSEWHAGWQVCLDCKRYKGCSGGPVDCPDPYSICWAVP